MPERVQMRVQLSRRRGWRKPGSTVSVARPSKWGNPFRLVPDGGGWYVEIEEMRVSDTRADKCEAASFAVNLFRSCLNYDWNRYPSLAEIRSELAGKNLACWCPLDQPCHADVLLEIANRPEPGT